MIHVIHSRCVLVTIVSLLSSTLAACFAGGGAKPELPEPSTKPAAANSPQQQALVDAARVLWVDMRRIVKDPDRLTMCTVELLGMTSSRLCDAELGMAADDGARARLIEEHRDRMKDVVTMLEAARDQGRDVTVVEIAQATYFLREAEFRLARLKRGAAANRDPEAKRLVESASEAARWLDVRREEDEALTPIFYHLICESSARLCAAELITADTHGEQIGAFERDRRRMREEIKHYSGLTDGAGWPQVKRATYELRAADVALMRLDK